MEPRKKQKIDEVVLTGLWVLFSLLLALCASCLLSAVLIVVFCVAAVVAAAVRAVGPFRRVRGQALLPLAPHVMPRCS